MVPVMRAERTMSCGDPIASSDSNLSVVPMAYKSSGSFSDSGGTLTWGPGNREVDMAAPEGEKKEKGDV
jgi:hypothetical protein